MQSIRQPGQPRILECQKTGTLYLAKSNQRLNKRDASVYAAGDAAHVKIDGVFLYVRVVL